MNIWSRVNKLKIIILHALYKVDNYRNNKMKANFDSIISVNYPVLVDFHALWCGPCKTQSPILKQVAEELGERVRVIKIDVDQNQSLASKYQIQSVPTLMIFKNGQVIHKQPGVHTKAQLMSILIKNM